MNSALLDNSSTESARTDSAPGATKPTAEQRPASLPVAVLTNDPAFAEQLRIALEGAPPMTTVGNMDAVVALAAAGCCSILVTDLAMRRTTLDAFTRTLRAHDPALAIVVAGSRDDDSTLIALQSAGLVDGFLLKPITSAATQLVIGAATRRYRRCKSERTPMRSVRARVLHESERPVAVADAIELGDEIDARRPPRTTNEAARPVIGARRERSRRPRRSSAILAAAAIAAIIGAGAVWFSRLPRSEGTAPDAIVAKHLALAEDALAAGRLLNARDGAAHHYRTVLAVDPENPTAHRGLDSIAHELGKQTQAHIAQRRFAEAAISLARLHELQPSHAELQALNAQLNALQEALVASYVKQEFEAPAVLAAVSAEPERETEPAHERTPARSGTPMQSSLPNER